MKTIFEMKEKLAAGEVSSKELVEKCLEKVEKFNPEINAFVSVNHQAISRASELDQQSSAGKTQGSLHGIPLAIKDLLCHKGMETTAASKILKGFVPAYSSTVTERLEKAGAIILGKTNLDEFAMGSSNENSFFGPVRNPWNKNHVAGGSSGGSAAAVGAEMVPAAIGTDTGGSIRQPASFCGLVGIKPTYGRVSRYGIVAFASSLDQAGPMTHTTKDAALLLEAIAGHDHRDSTSSQRPVPNWCEQINTDIKKKKIGLVKEFDLSQVREDVRQIFQQTKAYLEKQGAEFVEVSVPSIKYSVPVYYMVATAEASSNLARYDGIRYGYRSSTEASQVGDLDTLYKQSRGEGFGPEVKRRILLGTYSLSSGYYDAYYLKACQVRRKIAEEMQSAFSVCDVLMSPVTTEPAFRLGEKINDPIAMYLNDIFTTSANLAGLPGISVPVGISREGLPVGLQFLAPHFEEQRLFDFSEAVECRHDWKENKANGI